MLIDDQKLECIRDYSPNIKRHDSLLTAAVAIILRDGEHGTEFLMMQRAFHEKDPWSGQMSFPGGKLDPQDDSHKAAAIREAFEEVGIELSSDDYLGQVDDVYGLKANGVFSVHVACYVFKPCRAYTLTANEEVADMVWLPFSILADPSNATDFYHPHDASLKMPAVLIDAHKSQVLWGLSLRMLLNLYRVTGVAPDGLTEQELAGMHDIERLERRSPATNQATSETQLNEE